MRRISKRVERIIKEVHARWQETIQVGKPDVARAKECLAAGYENGIGAWRFDKYKNKPVRFFTVASPVQFALATAIIRGRMSKTAAKTFCETYNIDAAFIKELRRDRLVHWNVRDNRRWAWMNRNGNEFARTWHRLVDPTLAQQEQTIAHTVGARATRWAAPRRPGNQTDTLQISLNSIDATRILLQSTIADVAGPPNDVNRSQFERRNTPFSVIWNTLILDSNVTQDMMGSITSAYDMARLALDDDETFAANSSRWNTITLNYTTCALDSEIICRALGVTDLNYTWEHEVYHHLTTFACFQQSCVILAARPTQCFNDAGDLHNSEGPAVYWADGSKLWYIDGHLLDEGGRQIVSNPRELTVQKIMNIRNEETRRLAIDKYDLEQFIVEAGCPILDHRENMLDNTIEMLIGPPETANNLSRFMVLFCRSTGRRYLLAVPRNTETCEAGQRWMAGGGVNARVPYARHEINLLGAT